MAKSKRKRVKSLNLTEADLIAPLNSHRMDYYNGNQKMKVLDYSSGNPDHKRFGIIIRDGGEACKVIVEPDDTMANAIKILHPAKFFGLTPYFFLLHYEPNSKYHAGVNTHIL